MYLENWELKGLILGQMRCEMFITSINEKNQLFVLYNTFGDVHHSLSYFLQLSSSLATP